MGSVNDILKLNLSLGPLKDNECMLESWAQMVCKLGLKLDLRFKEKDERNQEIYRDLRHKLTRKLTRNDNAKSKHNLNLMISR